MRAWEWKGRWLAYGAIVVAGAMLHLVAWWARTEGAGKVAELPCVPLQHAIGLAIGMIIMKALAPLVIEGPVLLKQLLRGPRQTIKSCLRLWLKVALFVGLFGVWIPWEFWLR